MPNSIIWIGLVAVWLFVLLPMLMTKRPQIMQTTDAALATRVLYRGGTKRKQRGPATGHRSDPHWRPEDDLRVSAPASEIFGATTATVRPDSLDLPGTAEDPMDTHAAEKDLDRDAPAARASSPAHEPGVVDDDFVPRRHGRGGFDPEADSIARAARYSFRQRAVLGLVFAAITTAALAFIISPTIWWLCGLSVAVLVGYLYYLRRQVQIEEEVRRRRLTRMGRSRLGVESETDDELELVPQRLRRPGAVVLEIDDEDPEFEHLDHYDEPFQASRDEDRDLRRVQGA
ncbi:putative integral membrane protein [Rhodococcus sp. AW25M09]|uniref:divisome protein SepX/GlpR n=1 Tax=Rhodococcus sp. AW25M09 TaxID=1268303 RepID=UPI0002ABBC94|nr:gephyrin-like molybdotransferase receptor GlpR [Rhodococcus sp. AW25M09]CCQ17604.1 putative integral membrane protein [Rhodococcus sp. AW25M09]